MVWWKKMESRHGGNVEKIILLNGEEQLFSSLINPVDVDSMILL
jgi:hypothetical protein